MSRSQRNLALGAVLIVAAAAAAYFYFRNRGSGELPTQYSINGVCLACGKDARVSHRSDESAPFECAACKARAVYPWLFCANCNKRLVPELDYSDAGKPPRMPPYPQCPQCKGQSVGDWIPQLHGEKPETLPLPKLKGR